MDIAVVNTNRYFNKCSHNGYKCRKECGECNFFKIICFHNFASYIFQKRLEINTVVSVFNVTGFNGFADKFNCLLHRLEKEHFGRAEGDSEEVLLNCDLLILDDVGTEFSSPFYTSALYNIINGRMLDGKPTIISTNLNQKELADRYGEAVASRITGTFQPLVCAGADVRLLKLKSSIGGN